MLSGFRFSPTKDWQIFQISKDVLDLFCSPCPEMFYSFWSLFFKLPFDWFNVIFDVLLVGCFCEAGFLQMMVHGNINTRDYCAFSTLPFRTSADTFPPLKESSMLPLSYWHLCLHLQAQPICDLPDLADVWEHLTVADEVLVDDHDGDHLPGNNCCVGGKQICCCSG